MLRAAQLILCVDPPSLQIFESQGGMFSPAEPPLFVFHCETASEPFQIQNCCHIMYTILLESGVFLRMHATWHAPLGAALHAHDFSKLSRIADTCPLRR